MLTPEAVIGFDPEVFPAYGSCEALPEWVTGVLFRAQSGAESVLAIIDGDLLVNIETSPALRRRGHALTALEILVRQYGVRRSVPTAPASVALHRKAGFAGAGVETEWCRSPVLMQPTCRNLPTNERVQNAAPLPSGKAGTAVSGRSR